MKTSKAIQLDFQNAKAQAKQVENCAEEMDRINAKLENIISELSSGWKGDAAATYLDKCEQLSAKIQKSSSDLTKISASISKTAKVYYDAEKRAQELAEQRTHG